MKKLDRGDLMEATLAWVTGILMQECMPGRLYYGQFHKGDGTFEYVKFDRFVLSVHNTVYKYIRGQKTLDGTCTDMECSLSIKAKHIFGWYGE